MAQKLEQLPIHRKAVDFCGAVSAILDRPALRRNRSLHQQIDDANDSILSNMAEGFEQPTDKALANYLFVAKGSVAEVLKRLSIAQRKRLVAAEDVRRCESTGEELMRMLGGWIKYLDGTDWKDRGRHRA